MPFFNLHGIKWHYPEGVDFNSLRHLIPKARQDIDLMMARNPGLQVIGFTRPERYAIRHQFGNTQVHLMGGFVEEKKKRIIEFKEMKYHRFFSIDLINNPGGITEESWDDHYEFTGEGYRTTDDIFGFNFSYVEDVSYAREADYTSDVMIIDYEVKNDRQLTPYEYGMPKGSITYRYMFMYVAGTVVKEAVDESVWIPQYYAGEIVGWYERWANNWDPYPFYPRGIYGPIIYPREPDAEGKYKAYIWGLHPGSYGFGVYDPKSGNWIIFYYRGRQPVTGGDDYVMIKGVGEYNIDDDYYSCYVRALTVKIYNDCYVWSTTMDNWRQDYFEISYWVLPVGGTWVDIKRISFRLPYSWDFLFGYDHEIEVGGKTYNAGSSIRLMEHYTSEKVINTEEVDY